MKMNKNYLLPLTLLVLAACQSQKAPESPATVATSTAYDLQTEVQSAEMPSSMNMPSLTQNIPAPQPISMPQPVANTVSTAKQTLSQAEDFFIPRDASGKPIYSQMTKGSYSNSHYTVQKGDTMYLIGFISGKGAEEIARLNNLTYPYALSVGQTLKLR